MIYMKVLDRRKVTKVTIIRNKSKIKQSSHLQTETKTYQDECSSSNESSTNNITKATGNLSGIASVHGRRRRGGGSSQGSSKVKDYSVVKDISWKEEIVSHQSIGFVLRRNTVVDGTLGDRASIGKTEGSTGEGKVGELHCV